MTELSREAFLKVLDVVLEEFREEVDPDIIAHKIRVLLVVAQNPGIPQVEVVDHVKGLSQSTASRNVVDWSHLDKNRKAGIEFIEQRQDPEFRRRNQLFLTAKGQQFIDRLVKKANKVLSPPKRGTTH